MARIESPVALEKYRKNLLSERDPDKPCITLCTGSACLASGSAEVAENLEAELASQGLADEVTLRKTGCHGYCERGPIIGNKRPDHGGVPVSQHDGCGSVRGGCGAIVHRANLASTAELWGRSGV